MKKETIFAILLFLMWLTLGYVSSVGIALLGKLLIEVGFNVTLDINIWAVGGLLYIIYILFNN